MIFLLLACSTEPDCNSGTSIDPAADTRCPCVTSVWVLPAWKEANCRPDQAGHVEWEPAMTGNRGENEDRVGGVLVCECRP